MAWVHKFDRAIWAPLLTTGGNLLFTGGTNDRIFRAFDAKNGKILWEFNTGSGISAAPMTYVIDGKQYVAVVSGRSQSIPAFFGEVGQKIVDASAEGGTLFVFAVN